MNTKYINTDNFNNRAYYGKKEKNGNSYNYDLIPLIKNFNFTEFLSTDTKTEHGAVLVITNKQYIIGYTAEYGLGTHKSAFARIMKSLHKGKRIQDSNEVKKLEEECTQKFITARILYDYRGDNEYGIQQYSGAIYFQFPKDDTITKMQYELFKMFYEEYNKEIKMLIRKYGINKFKIQYGHIDETGTKEIKNVDSLDDIYTYLEKRVDTNKNIDITEEQIIGTILNINHKKIKKK